MPTVLLAGAFGQGNPGDEALCASFRAALPDVRLIVTSRAPAVTAIEHDCEAIPATGRAVARTLRHVDCVVVGGGTVFKTLHPSSGRRANALLRSAAALAAGARVRGVRLAMIGVGAGELPGREARALTRRLVQSTDLLVLRDEESAAVLSGAGVPAPFRVGADAAWSLLGAPPELHRRDREGTVTVALSHLAGGRSLLEGLTAALAPLIGRVRVRLQPWQVAGEGQDHRMGLELRDRLGGQPEIIEPPHDLRAARDLFATDQLVIGLRFHALVAAGAAGTPLLAIAHEPKLAGLARRLGQPAAPAHAAPAVLARAVDLALEQTPPAPAAVRAEIAAAEEAFGLLRLLLDNGRLDEPNDISCLSGLPLSTGAGAW